MNHSNIPLEQQFYFNAVLDEPLSFKLQKLRDDTAYDIDSNAEITALRFIEKLSNCISCNIYVIVAGNDIAPSNKLRTRKGALWGDVKLQKLDSRNIEVLIDHINTRLFSLIDLKCFDYDHPSKVLNWMSSMLILSNLNLDELASSITSWISKDKKSALPYDHDAIAKSLHCLTSTVIVRYFPADNGKAESLVAVGHKRFLEDRVATCIENLLKY